MNADDQDLIAQCLLGQTDAFAELVARYQDRLLNTVLRMLDHPEDARDVVQETFLHAWQALPTFKGDSQLFTWLYRIAINTAISLQRKNRPLGLRRVDAELDIADASEMTRPGRGMEMAEEEQRVHEALARLSQEHRAVLVMKDMDGMKYEEMAVILNVPVGTIRSRLHRARLELRDVFLQLEARSEQ